MSGGLDRRLSALERNAEECRRREVREMILTWPEFGRLTPTELEEATGEALRYLREIRCQR